MPLPAAPTPTDEVLPRVRETLDKTYHLVFPYYDDRLGDRQVRQLVYGQGDDLVCDIADTWDDERDYSAHQYATDTVAAWCRDHALPDDVDEDELIDDIRMEILDRDRSDPLPTILDTTPCPLLSVMLIGEDEDCNNWIPHIPPAHYLRSAGLPVTSRTVEIMRGLIFDTPSDLHMGWVIFKAEMRELWDTVDDPTATVTITDPTIILGNSFTGGYWDAQFPDCSLTVTRASLRVDGDCGYSVDDCYGGYILASPPATITASHSRTA